MLKLCLFMLLSIPVVGQKIIIDEHLSSQDINDNVFIYTKPAGIDKLDNLIKATSTDFTKNTTAQNVSYGYHWQQGWCKFTIQNKSDTRKFIFNIEQSRADTVQLFVQKPYQKITAFPILGRHIAINDRIFFDRNYVYPLEIPIDSTYTYYLYSSRKFGHHGCMLTLKSEKNYTKYIIASSAQFGFIFGASIITALLGLALFVFIRERTYLIYSLYCFSTLLVGLSDAGYVHSYLHFPQFQPIINIATVISFYLLVGLHILFTIELLHIKAYKNRWFYYLGRYSTWLFIGSALLLLLPLPFKLTWWLVYLSYYMVFFMDIYIAIAIINGIRKKLPSAYFYMVGFFLTLILFTILMLANLGVIDDINNKVDFFYFTPLVEVIVMVMGLGMRFSNSVKERFIFQKKLNETQQQIITLQEDERTRIARDLHDDVGNSLAALKTKFIYQKRIEDSQQTQQIIEDLRTITHNIMPANFQDFSLDKMLETLINRFQHHPTIVFEFIAAGQSVKLDSTIELSIYRITNELITNILKYSKATTVTIQTVYQYDRMILSFEDDGQPFSLKNHLPIGNAIGVNSIMARLDFIQAKFSSTSDNNGNILIIDIPYTPHE